ncbi:MAG TPA: DUF4157 domain-containing protein, partial [Rhizobacter sp.]|nr:DUF4157 domain-containing protein [Rhizobacter sp.]
MKTPSPRDEPEATRRPAADQPLASAGPAESTLDDSPRQVAQRHQIDTAFAAGEAPNRTGMPDTLKAGIESLSGQDMSDVRVHRNSDKPGQLNALAYAQGNDIHLAPGQEQHLPHEAWHVVQQR